MSPEQPPRKEQIIAIYSPERIETVQVFQQKFNEYKKRLQEQTLQYGKSPVNPKQLNEVLDTRYKMKVISSLLTEGKADWLTIQKELKEQDLAVDFTILEDAFMVINDYKETGGKNIKGGTGLK